MTLAMKKGWYLLLGLLFCLACEKEDLPREIIMKVRDTKATCVGAHGPMECLQVQTGDKIGTQQWEFHYDGIQGFTYEPGYIYTLRVKTKKLKNPPADASDTEYRLLEVVSREKV
jgi:hypothetical protein